MSDLKAAIAVFDKSADRTTPNAQTEAWKVIRAELMRLQDAPVAEVTREDWLENLESFGPDLIGQRVRLVRDGGEP